jgi:Fibronectin type III domain
MELRKGRVRVVRLAVGAAIVMLGYGINIAAAPAAPSNLTASVSGNNVNLSWSAPPGAVLGYRVEAGSAPGQSNLHSGVYGPTPQLSAPNVPTGIYYVRVRAIASDGEGPPSNEVTLTVGAGGPCAAPPGAPTGLTATVTGTTIAFNWAAGGGCPASNFALQAGSGPGMSNLAVANVGTSHGLTTAAPPGTYYVRVVAQNAFGVSLPSNQQVVSVGGSNPGGSGGNTGGPTALTPLGGMVSSFGYRILPVTMPATGDYRATLTWGDSSIDLDLYLTSTLCASYPPTNACMRASSAAGAGNLEQISWHVQAGQTYYVWVDNFTHRVSDYLIQHTVNGAALTEPQSETPDASEIFRKPKQY